MTTHLDDLEAAYEQAGRGTPEEAAYFDALGLTEMPRLVALLTEPTVFDRNYASPKTTVQGVEVSITSSGYN